MSINFDSLPTEKPFALPPEGFYKAKIIKAEMRAAKNEALPPELNMTYALTNAAGKKCGNMFDTLRESDKPAQLYKISRFVKALGLELSGSIELKDLAKLVVNKELVVDLEHNKYTSSKTGKEMANAQVALFREECYYPIEDFEKLIALEPTVAPTDDEPTPFSIDDLVEDDVSDDEPTESNDEY